MFLGFILAICAGVLIGLQNIFNRHLNVHVSGWAATAFVLLTGSLASLIFGLIFEGTALFHLSELPLSYFFFGLVGIGVIYCMLSGMKKLGPTKAVIISVIAQLTCSLIFDAVGLLALPQVDIQWMDIAGLLLMFVGIYIFSYEKRVAKV
ncbi:MAG: DMT family transporter [Solibacillus sp.]